MRTLIIILFTCFFTSAFGQDLIVRTNTDTIKGYISEVGKDEIRYRKVDDRKAPVYTIKKSLVGKIVYENGESEVFGTSEGGLLADKYPFRHRVSWVYTDVFIARFMVAYEYFPKSGYVGIRVPFSAGLSLFNGTNALTYSTGIDVDIYPTTARGTVKYFFGPQIRVGYSPADIWTGDRNIFTSLSFANGLSVNVLPQLNLSGYLGLGIKYAHYIDYANIQNTDPYYYHNVNQLYPHMSFGFSVGYNFGGK